MSPRLLFPVLSGSSLMFSLLFSGLKFEYIQPGLHIPIWLLYLLFLGMLLLVFSAHLAVKCLDLSPHAREFLSLSAEGHYRIVEYNIPIYN